ncbi:hypothetical protein C8J57DRAFT_1522174 [Mycena rebaudengoi]|nr:hypothetical protein C8J57DRAFT_1522174 [Mycena rebaudengoi]
MTHHPRIFSCAGASATFFGRIPLSSWPSRTLIPPSACAAIVVAVPHHIRPSRSMHLLRAALGRTPKTTHRTFPIARAVFVASAPTTTTPPRPYRAHRSPPPHTPHSLPVHPPRKPSTRRTPRSATTTPTGMMPAAVRARSTPAPQPRLGGSTRTTQWRCATCVCTVLRSVIETCTDDAAAPRRTA